MTDITDLVQDPPYKEITVKIDSVFPAKSKMEFFGFDPNYTAVYYVNNRNELVQKPLVPDEQGKYVVVINDPKFVPLEDKHQLFGEDFLYTALFVGVVAYGVIFHRIKQGFKSKNLNNS